MCGVSAVHRDQCGWQLRLDYRYDADGAKELFRLDSRHISAWEAYWEVSFIGGRSIGLYDRIYWIVLINNEL